MVKGIYHSHSDFSYDGVKSLREISKWCQERGFDFIILTEHNDDFSLEKFRDFIDQCRQHSAGTLLVPGIEYEFIINDKVVHIGAVGLNKYFDINENPRSLESILDEIRTSGGISILHHPHRILDVLSERVLCKFDFIEAWNVVHDIRYSPNKKVIEKAEQAGFKGQYLASRDIHYFRDKDSSPYVVLNKDVSVTAPGDTVDALLGGKYRVSSKTCTLRPDGTFEPSKMIYKYLPAVSFVHQRSYEKLRLFYKKRIKITPPRWLVKAIK
jgi:predicted metal-dependent phosphoesterase TrpH